MVSLEDVLTRVSEGRFMPTLHALARMNERDVRADDVRAAAQNCVECRWQEANATWRLTGKTEDGERLVVVIGAHPGGLTLVTVHWEREKV